MTVKNHNGRIRTATSWTNAYGEFEICVFGRDQQFLWQYAEDSEYEFDSERLEEGRLYAQTYSRVEGGRRLRRGDHLLYIFVAENGDDETEYVEVGPDGYVNPGCWPSDRLVEDVKSRILIPLRLVDGAGDSPSEAVPASHDQNPPDWMS